MKLSRDTITKQKSNKGKESSRILYNQLRRFIVAIKNCQISTLINSFPDMAPHAATWHIFIIRISL